MERRRFIQTAGGGIILAAVATTGSGCTSSAYPSQAVEAWQGPSATETDPRRRALAYAITAPNPHNLQPWLADLREPGVITVHTDPERALPETDPLGRQILIGHGAFLELLVIALAELGFTAQVELWPRGELSASLADWRTQSRPIARIALQAGSTKDPLFAQILKRHTAKTAFDLSRPVAQDQLAELATALAPGQTPIRFGATVEPAQLEALRGLCFAAAQVEVNTPRTMLESIRLIRVGPSEIQTHRDGISINSGFVRAMSALGMFDRNSAPAPGSPGHKSAMERFETHSKTAMGFVWLAGPNTRLNQIQSGRAYARLHLKATALGIAMHPMSQALQEFPEMKPHYAKAHELTLAKPAPLRAEDPTLQMLCRVGYPSAGESLAPTPRRALAHFVRQTA